MGPSLNGISALLDLALIQEEAPETLKNHYELLAHHAGECNECDHGLRNCPFGVEIIHKIKQAIQLFGH